MFRGSGEGGCNDDGVFRSPGAWLDSLRIAFSSHQKERNSVREGFIKRMLGRREDD